MMRMALLAALLAARPSDRSPLPSSLVVDIRLFEVRSANPDLSTLHKLSHLVKTDGRGVTSNQWLATVVNHVPGSRVAALAYETIPVKKDSALVSWSNGSRSFDVDIRFDNYHHSQAFTARVIARWMRGGDPIHTFSRELRFQVNRTSIWSGPEMEIAVTDYISHFREYQDREHRGMLFEKLRDQTIYLILVATPRLAADEEKAQLTPESLDLPPGTPIPEPENPFGIPLKGSLVAGFELDTEGKPVNPQVVWSTLPEVNPGVMEELLEWRFPTAARAPGKRKWGRVEIELSIP